MEMSTILPFKSDRVFQLWRYSASHGQLLIRSPKGPDSRVGFNEKNIDIYFDDVGYLQVPRFFHGVEISCLEKGIQDDIIETVRSKFPDDSIYKFVSSDVKFYVVGLLLRIEENSLGYMDDKLE
jgi:hypothetical protein